MTKLLLEDINNVILGIEIIYVSCWYVNVDLCKAGSLWVHVNRVYTSFMP